VILAENERGHFGVFVQYRRAAAGVEAMKEVNGSDYEIGLSHALMGCELFDSCTTVLFLHTYVLHMNVPFIQGDQIGRIFAYWAIVYFLLASFFFKIAELAHSSGQLARQKLCILF
jgi:hypothetical protein